MSKKMMTNENFYEEIGANGMRRYGKKEMEFWWMDGY